MEMAVVAVGNPVQDLFDRQMSLFGQLSGAFQPELFDFLFGRRVKLGAEESAQARGGEIHRSRQLFNAETVAQP